jgi:hypothetical protein
MLKANQAHMLSIQHSNTHGTSVDHLRAAIDHFCFSLAT